MIRNLKAFSQIFDAGSPGFEGPLATLAGSLSLALIAGKVPADTVANIRLV